MRFPTTCPHCLREVGVEFADSAIHDLTCPHCGRAFCVFVRKQKFEVLFDLGTRALMDGYAREAVASFAASLERFFEFYIRAFALEQAAQRSQTEQRPQEGQPNFEEAVGRLERTWRHVASQSERQVGMMALAYLLRQGREPDFLTAAALGADFRNRVIHRGYLPGRAEVDAYAARVFALIDRLLAELGSGAAQAELEQERLFARHLAALGDGVIAVFEEHPGMFRARRFGGGNALGPKNLPAQPARTLTPAPLTSTHSAPPINDAQAFQKALKERGPLLKGLKK